MNDYTQAAKREEGNDHEIDVIVAAIAKDQGCWELPDADLIEFGKRVWKSAKSGAASPAEGPTAQLYVISVTGDGGQTTIVEESQLKQALHEAYCSCGKGLDKCEDEVIANTIARLDDPEEWTQNYPTYERHIWLDHGEDYTVQVMRVSRVAERIGASGPKPSPRCPICQSTDLTIYGHSGDFFLHCSDDQTHPAHKVETAADFAQFFTPSAGEPQS